MKFYEKTWFTVIALFLFFPIGLFLMWKYEKFNKGIRILISIFFGFSIIGYMFGISSNDQAGTETSTKDFVPEVEANMEEQSTTAKTNSDESKQAEDDSKRTALGNLSERPVMNGTKTERIGTYIHIHSDRPLLTEASLKEFVRHDLPRFKNMNWILIDLNDGYGLHFMSTLPLADYGKIEDGSIFEAYENFMINVEEDEIQKHVFEGMSGYKPLF